jgi:uncharacterized membrane protein
MPPEAEPLPPEAGTAAAPSAPQATGRAQDLRAYYEANKAKVWAVGLALPVAIVAVGLVVAPTLFWDQFLWAHVWGSAVADATQRGVATHNGITVTEDYTLGSYAIYGPIMAVALYGIYAHVIQRHGVRVDAGFVAAILPFILYGPVGRTLEDTSMFCRNAAGAGCDPSVFSYLFISPFLYGQIAVAALLFILLGVHLDRSTAPLRTKTTLVGGVLLAGVALYGLVWATMASDFRVLAHPGVVLLGAALGLGVFHLLQQRGHNGVNSSLAAGGLFFVLPGLSLIALWLSGQPWGNTILGRFHLDAAPWVLGIPLLAVVLVYAMGRLGGAKDARLLAYTLPINLGLVYGHMLDAFASFIAICSNPQGFCQGAVAFGLSLPAYGEKHPVSNAILGSLDGWGFPLVKFALVIGIVWVLDVEYRKDLEREPNLGGLVKMAILVLGFGPGMRDLLRLVMGT